MPTRELSTLEIAVEPHRLASHDFGVIEIGGQEFTGTTTFNLECVRDAVSALDPDALILNTGGVLPALFEAAEKYDIAGFQLGRRPGFEQLAGESTYQSYGRVGHSPARYNLPGRVIIDRSNTFFLNEMNLEGCLDMVNRSGKPLQELGWASIGNVLTAIQIQEALSAVFRQRRWRCWWNLYWHGLPYVTSTTV